MNVSHRLTAAMLGILHGMLTRPQRPDDRERGDVPGWVLITLMTAGLVTALWTLAGPQLEGLFSEAINSVRR